MHPLVGFAEELRRLRALTVAVAAEEGEIEYLVGTMIELPRACVRADEIAEHADFFSFGTNDLTQTALGFSRDDAEGKFLTHYLQDGVLERNPFEILDQSGRRRPDADRRRAGERREGRPEARHLRRARRRARVGRVLPRARARLRLLLAVPRAARPACRCAGRARGAGVSRTSPRAADGDPRGRPALARHLAARVAGAGRRGVARALQRAHGPPLPPVSRRPRRPRRCGGVRELGVRLGRGSGGVPFWRTDRRREPRHVRVLGGRSLGGQRADDRRRLDASLRCRRARRRSSGTTGRSKSAGAILPATGIVSRRAGRSTACTPRGCGVSTRGPTASLACR